MDDTTDPTATVDVTIVGGGIQGLVLLRELSDEGYACVLVTKHDLGAGQTLHSHGALVSGAGLITGGLSRVVDDVTVPYLERLGLALHRDDPFLLAVPEGMAAELAPVWEANGYAPQPADRVPGFEPDVVAYRVPGCNVDKRALVRALARGVSGRVVRGEVQTTADGSLAIRRTSGRTVRLRSGAVVVSAGCGTQALLRTTFAAGRSFAERIGYTRMHMLCIEAPARVLPRIGAVVAPDVFVAGHRRRRGVIWYVTPADPSGAGRNDVPDDAAAPVEPQLVAAAVAAVRRLFPALRDADERVRATVFAGYKQELDGMPTQRACEPVDPDRNIVVALPSILANAVPNARDAVAILRERVEPSHRPVRVPGAGRVRVGTSEEDGRTQWRPWPAFVDAYAG